MRLLCELTVGFGRGFVERSYRELAAALGKSWATIARAARALRESGDIQVETLRDRSYRWYVVLETDDIVADPEGVFVVRESATQEEPETFSEAGGVMSSMPWGHVTNDMTLMSTVPCHEAVSGEVLRPDDIRVLKPFKEAEKAALNIHVKDQELKIHQQTASLETVTEQKREEKNDDEPVGHKSLLRRLLGLGMRQRIARKVVREHDHQLVAQALESVARRHDVKNPAGYILRELEDGGYETEWLETPENASSGVSHLERKPVKHSDAPIVSCSVWETKAENERLEAQRLEKEKTYREDFKALYDRFQGLTEGLKSKLKVYWTEHLDKMLPNTPRKQAMLEEQTFQRMAFKEVTERFFALVDEGFEPEGALVKLGA